MKVLGAIELWRTRFDYRQESVFNAAIYLGFLEQLARRYRRQGAILIQDNASYHKDADGRGSSPTSIGWKCINYRPTRPN